MRARARHDVRNIEFRRADLLELGPEAGAFDLIESGGVLHHLRDPLAGWRLLVDRLAPQGIMRIGLYSAIGREGLVPARQFAAEHGYGPDAPSLRAFRAAVIARPPTDPVRAGVVGSSDFYALSGVRDLLFHVEEHVFTVPAIAEALAGLRLRFIGFEANDDLRLAYRRRFPDDPPLTDLANWARFEAENRSIFAAMYIFWCARE
jgi:SAM-dependent methyltransferase